MDKFRARVKQKPQEHSSVRTSASKRTSPQTLREQLESARSDGRESSEGDRTFRSALQDESYIDYITSTLKRYQAFQEQRLTAATTSGKRRAVGDKIYQLENLHEWDPKGYASFDSSGERLRSYGIVDGDGLEKALTTVVRHGDVEYFTQYMTRMEKIIKFMEVNNGASAHTLSMLERLTTLDATDDEMYQAMMHEQLARSRESETQAATTQTIIDDDARRTIRQAERTAATKKLIERSQVPLKQRVDAADLRLTADIRSQPGYAEWLASADVALSRTLDEEDTKVWSALSGLQIPNKVPNVKLALSQSSGVCDSLRLLEQFGEGVINLDPSKISQLGQKLIEMAETVEELQAADRSFQASFADNGSDLESLGELPLEAAPAYTAAVDE